MNKTNETIMKEACDLASHSVSIGGGPFGCVITDKNLNIVGKGLRLSIMVIQDKMPKISALTMNIYI